MRKYRSMIYYTLSESFEDNRLIFREKKDKNREKWFIRARNSRYLFRGVISQRFRREGINRAVRILVSRRALRPYALTAYHSRT